MFEKIKSLSTQSIGKWASFLLIAYSVLLFLLAILPINSKESSINNSYILQIRMDYLLHFTVFFVWMSLLWLSLIANKKTNPKLVLVYIFIGLLFAVFNESIQYVLPYRAFNINDLVANGLGILLGAILFIK
jgi:VanZ family protein